MRFHFGKIHEDAARILRQGVVVKIDVLLHRELADGAIAHAFFGDKGHAGLHSLVERCAGNLPAADGYLTGRGFAHARQTFGQLALTIARYAGKPHDFSGVDLQVNPAQGLGPAVAHGVQSLDLESHFSGI